ncbi:hypothetical protein MRX96_054676 [Rhipicephalus microplus]
MPPRRSCSRPDRATMPLRATTSPVTSGASVSFCTPCYPDGLPFQTPSRNASAAALMQRIREGDFSFSGPQWEPVSDQAKDVIRGLLTVEITQRLTMNELRAHPWVHTRGSLWSCPADDARCPQLVVLPLAQQSRACVPPSGVPPTCHSHWIPLA